MNTLQTWLDRHLVPEWRRAWRWSSVRLAAGMAFVVGLLAQQPQLALSIVNYMPADPTQRAIAALGIGAVAFFGPTVTRLWKQGGGNDAAE